MRSAIVSYTTRQERLVTMLRRSTCISVASLLFSLAVLATGGILLSQPVPRELSGNEKQALRGGNNTTFQGKCCQPIAACQNLPSNNGCDWYTQNGKLTCLRGLASQYNYNGNSKSCTGTEKGVLCDLGATAACIVVQSCTWNMQLQECVTFGDWEGSEPGYSSCDPDCST
jgi:hypothetical protein